MKTWKAGMSVLGAVALVLALYWPGTACAQLLQVDVHGEAGPLADAVVSLHGVGAGMAAPVNATMGQRDSTFVPGVLPVQVGAVVRFPNSDNIQHQVYSFSPAKQFELPLYAGRDARPIRFETPGVVVLGCNIHDWMVGHIVVLDTPYFAKTGADGRVRLQAPAGDYVLRVWHVRAPEGNERRVALAGAGASQRVLLPVPRVSEEIRGNDRLRALQEKFRRLKDAP